MGQYFVAQNLDREEWFATSGGAKAGGRITDSIFTGMLSYLLLDGPQDGTHLIANGSIEDFDDEEVEDFLQRQRASEWDQYRRYTRDPPSYITGRFEREYDMTPGEDRDLFRQFCKEEAYSVYRNDDGSWKWDKIAQIMASKLHISEGTEFGGRWAGDDVRIVGDYEESGLYDERKGTALARLDDGNLVLMEGVWHPTHIIPEQSHGSSSMSYTDTREDAEPGETIRVWSGHTTEEYSGDQYAEFIEYEESDWDDISKPLQAEFESVVPEDWVEDHTGGVLMPDMVLS